MITINMTFEVTDPCMTILRILLEEDVLRS